jgi:hypothetical protein
VCVLYRFDESDNYITIFEVNSVHSVHRGHGCEREGVVVMAAVCSLLTLFVMPLSVANLSDVKARLGPHTPA